MLVMLIGIGARVAKAPSTANYPVSETLTLEKLQKLMKEWSNLLANSRRSSLTIVVRQGYEEGCVVQEKTATEGVFIEMSWLEAQHIHQYHWPLVLQEVVDNQTAYFRPAHEFDLNVRWLGVLPMPPYEASPQGA